MEEGLKVILSADVSAFENAFVRATQATRQAVQQINNNLKGADTGMTALANSSVKLVPHFEKLKAVLMQPYMREFGGHTKEFGAALSQASQGLKNGTLTFDQLLKTVKFTDAEMAKLPAIISSIPIDWLQRGIASAEKTLVKFADGKRPVGELKDSIERLKNALPGLGNSEPVQKLIQSLNLLTLSKKELSAQGLEINPKVHVADTIRDIETIKGLIASEKFTFDLSANPAGLNASLNAAGAVAEAQAQRIQQAVSGISFQPVSSAPLVQRFEAAHNAAKKLQDFTVLSATTTKEAVEEINTTLAQAGGGYGQFAQKAQKAVADYVRALGQMQTVPTAVKTTVQAPDMTPVIQAVQRVKSEITNATVTALPKLTLSADTTPFTTALLKTKAVSQETWASIKQTFTGVDQAIAYAAEKAKVSVQQLVQSFNALKGAGPNAVVMQVQPPNYAPVIQAARVAKQQINQVFVTPLPPIKVPQFTTGGLPELKRNLHDTTGVGLQFNQLLREMPNFAIDARIGVMSLSNNLPYFVDAIQNARKQGQGFTGILKTIGSSIFSVSGIAILAVTAFTAFAGSMRKSKEEVADFGKEMREATRGAISEVATIQALVTVARDENNTRTQRLNAINELQKKYPEYLRNLNLENVNSLATAKAIDELTRSLVQKAVAQAYADKIADATLKRDELRDKLLDKTNEQLKRQIGFQQEIREMEGKGGIPKRAVDNEAIAQQRLNREIAGMQKELQNADAEVDKYTKNLQDTTAATLALTRTPKEVKLKTDKTGEDALRKLASYVKELNLQATVDFEAVPRIGPIKDIQAEYKESLKQQFNKHVDIPLTLNFTAEQVKVNALSSGVDKVFTDYIEKFRDAKVKMPQIDPNDFLKAGGAEQLAAMLQRILSQTVDFRSKMQSIMSQAATDSVAGFAEGIGEALAGGNLGNAFQNVLSVLGSAIQALGKELIASSAIIQAFKKALNSLIANPAAGLAVGAAMVAIGAAIKSSAGKFPKFADGGIVFGPTMGLMGEYAGASSNPEVIAPLSKLKDLIGNSGGNTNLSVNGSWDVSGDKLRLVLARSNRKNNRYS